MQKSRFLLASALATSSLFLLAQPAWSQDAAPQAAEDGAGVEDIVVTGSLIANPNLEKSSPVNVTTADEIELKQSNVAEEILRELPGVVPSIGSAVNNGNNGASYVNLRGLGDNRNIVLLDGFRIAPSDFQGRVDLNNIPLALIDRVDALTGAAVTTYGADAITGVVNFVTKRNFSGFEVTASEQITEEGDGNIFRVDATLGANFDDGRGNAVFSLGYQQADPVSQGKRRFSLAQIDSFSNTQLGSGTSVPSRFSGTRPVANVMSGALNLTPAFTQTGVTAGGVPILAPVTGGAANGGLRQLDPGTGLAAAGLFNSFNFNPFNIFQTPFERFNIYGQANYEVSDSVEVYARGLFSKNRVNTIVAPSGSFGSGVTINLNNPFLPTGLRNQFCAFNVAPVITGVDASGMDVVGQTTYTPRFTPTECAAAATATGRSDPNYREVNVTLNRRATEVGPRISEYQTTIFDYRLGFRGPVTDGINYDLSGGYGESENIQTLQNYTRTSRIRQGVLVNGTVANPVCQDTSNACVPVNIFGPDGSISKAAAAFISSPSTTRDSTTLAQVRGVISGDTGFSLPFAQEPVGFAVGAEYRKYTARSGGDNLAQTVGELGGSGSSFPTVVGGYDVYEAFGEIIAPIVEDKAFFKSLTFEGGIRYSRYSIDAPGTSPFNTTTYKFGGTYEPVSGLKFRGGYNRAVRAPNIRELFEPLNTQLDNLGTDPCAGAAPVANVNLRAVCIAQGAPSGTIGSILNPTAAQANFTLGGSLNLKPEKANTYTVGAVIQPLQVPGLSLSIDYYNIRVTKAIGFPTPGDLIGACFGNITATSATNPACTVIRRNPVTGGLDGDPATTPGLFGPRSNLGRLKTDGIDLVANYKRDLGFADLTLNFVGNFTNSSKFKATPTSINRECVGFYSPNCQSIQPKFQFSQRTTLGFGKVDVSLLWRFIDSVKYEPQQFADDLANAVAAGTNPNTGCPDPTGTDPNGCIVDPQFRKINAEHYFDLTTRFNITDNVTMTFTVQNLLDNQPKVVGNTIGTTAFNSGNVYPSTYDALGRRYAVSAKLKF
ncbi:MAG: TonB-dependent receptor [Sphingomonadales bacterium]|nr:TonB-dependent receptor [Sphingomonadales bacterium]